MGLGVAVPSPSVAPGETSSRVDAGVRVGAGLGVQPAARRSRAGTRRKSLHGRRSGRFPSCRRWCIAGAGVYGTLKAPMISPK